MTILIKTSGGGGIVLVVTAILLASHGGGIGTTAAAVAIALVAAVVLAVAGLAAYLLYRVRRERTAPRILTAVRVSPEPGEPPAGPRALQPPAVRLHQDQLEQLAEIIRRGQRPEQ